MSEKDEQIQDKPLDSHITEDRKKELNEGPTSPQKTSKEEGTDDEGRQLLLD